jgi:chromosome segregation ATPase
VTNIPFYLLQFALFVAIALCIGIFLGYLIWGGTALDLPGDLQPGDESEAVADLRAQVEAKDGEISRLRKRLKRAHADLEAHSRASGDAGELQAMMEARNADVAALTHQVSVLHQELEDARVQLPSGAGRDDAELASMMDELAAAQHERRRLEGEILSLRQALDDQVRAGNDLAESLGLLRAQAAGHQGGDDGTAAAAVHDALDRALAELAHARADAEAATDEADRASAALQRAEAEVTGLRLEVEELREAADAVSADAVSADAVTAGASTAGVADPVALARVQAELERSRASAVTWRERSAQAEDDAERLAGELAEATARLQAASGSISGADERIRQLEESMRGMEADAVEVRRLLSERSELDAASVERLRSENAELAARVRELDDLSRSLRSRAELADAAEVEAVRLGDELRASRHQGEQLLASLRLELADARLRSDEAHQALAELSTEFVTFRDTVLQQQNTVSSIADRLNRARGALDGRSSPPPAFVAAAEPAGRADLDAPDDLMSLPGATDALVRDLHELGVTTFAEIGSWDAPQLERFEEAVDDQAGIMRSNGWVVAARRIWEERHGVNWSDRDGGRVRA